MSIVDEEPDELSRNIRIPTFRTDNGEDNEWQLQNGFAKTRSLEIVSINDFEKAPNPEQEECQ